MSDESGFRAALLRRDSEICGCPSESGGDATGLQQPGQFLDKNGTRWQRVRHSRDIIWSQKRSGVPSNQQQGSAVSHDAPPHDPVPSLNVEEQRCAARAAAGLQPSCPPVLLLQNKLFTFTSTPSVFPAVHFCNAQHFQT